MASKVEKKKAKVRALKSNASSLEVELNRAENRIRDLEKQNHDLAFELDSWQNSSNNEKKDLKLICEKLRIELTSWQQRYEALEQKTLFEMERIREEGRLAANK